VALFAAVAAAVAAFSRDLLIAHLVAAFLFAAVAVALGVALRSLKGLEVSRAIQSTARDGDDLDIRFTVTNAGLSARSLVEVWNGYYSSNGATGRVAALAEEIGPGESAETVAIIKDLRRGEYIFGPPVLSAGDPLGMFSITRECDPFEWPTTRVTVFPTTFPINYLAIASDLSYSIAGVEPTNQAGASGDFLGTREYRPGDSVRFIHWPLSARMGELIVKEFERNTSTEVSIFLDLDIRAAHGEGRENTLEYAVRIAASVSDYALQRGNATQLIAHGHQWIIVPAGKGAYHQQLMMHYLASVEARGTVPFNYVIGHMAPRLKEGASAVLIFPSEHLQMELFGPALEGLWARRIRVTAIIMEVETFLSAGVPGGSMWAATYLASRGASVYLVRCGQDLAGQLSVRL
jgi:uncharacterized protein (DUF58 family)